MALRWWRKPKPRVTYGCEIICGPLGFEERWTRHDSSTNPYFSPVPSREAKKP